MAVMIFYLLDALPVVIGFCVGGPVMAVGSLSGRPVVTTISACWGMMAVPQA
ncbi:hypothetical protein H7I56_08360 [Mycolicibacterium gilvum]|nr:hypothetical protein [Mycolicibacterium gilvum]